MESVTLSATVRDVFGKGAARKLRRDGKLPAIIYRGGDSATHIAIDPNELETIFRHSGNRNTLLKVDAGGSERICLVKDVQRHPLSQKIRHLDLYEVNPADSLDLRVPVVASGEAAGVKLGGKLRVIRREIDVRCKPADIPANISVDVTELEVGAMIRVSSVVAPNGVEIICKEDFNLITVAGKREVEVEEDDAATDAVEA
jgi:large subunit ribosomal protein L25